MGNLETKRILRGLIAFIAAQATTLVLAVVFHGFIMGEQFGVAAEQMNLDRSSGAGLTFYAILTAAMTCLYPRFYRGGPPALEGYKFGAIIGFIFILGVSIMHVRFKVSLWTVIPDILWHTFVEHAVAGLVIGVIYGRTVRPKPPDRNSEP